MFYLLKQESDPQWWVKATVKIYYSLYLRCAAQNIHETFEAPHMQDNYVATKIHNKLCRTIYISQTLVFNKRQK